MSKKTTLALLAVTLLSSFLTMWITNKNYTVVTRAELKELRATKEIAGELTTSEGKIKFLKDSISRAEQLLQ